jgi:hypothetical protein
MKMGREKVANVTVKKKEERGKIKDKIGSKRVK